MWAEMVDDYLRVWTLWIEGESLIGDKLWDYEILWLGRVGKIVQFVSAIVILLEIIGAERMNRFGRTLRKSIPLGKVAATLDVIGRSARYTFEEFMSDDDSRESKYEDLANETPIGRVINKIFWRLNFVLIAVNLLTLLIGWAFNLQDWAIYALPIIGATMMWPIILSVLALVLRFIIRVVDSIYVKPIIFILTRPYVSNLIKITSAVMLVIGFHFDLLAS